uniref:Putative conserved secreted protein n=1 Tax=Ixodes ricinus TaxID=34613 RepID=A0A6B0UCB0_IXORI
MGQLVFCHLWVKVVAPVPRVLATCLDKISSGNLLVRPPKRYCTSTPSTGQCKLRNPDECVEVHLRRPNLPSHTVSIGVCNTVLSRVVDAPFGDKARASTPSTKHTYS